jgi:hypothetical protein
MPTQALSPADSRSYLGFARQTVKGTGVAPSFFVPYVEAIQFAHNPNLRQVREAGGGNVIARQVKDYIAPSLQFGSPMRPSVAGAILAYFLGASGAPTGAGPYIHTQTPADGVQWVTFERNIADDVIERIIDGVFGQVTLNYQKRDSGPELMITGVVQGITEEDQVAPTAESYETDRPFLRSDCTWTVDTSLNPTNVEACTIDLQWALDATILADAVTRSSIVKLHLTGTVELIQLFESADEAAAYRLTHYYDGDASPGTVPGELVYPGDLQVEATYGAAAGLRTIDVAIPRVDWGEAELTENNPNASEAVRLTRRGIIVKPAAGAPITSTITNNRSTAYIA